MYQKQVSSLALSELSNYLADNTMARGIYDYDIDFGNNSLTGYEIAACTKYPLSAIKLNSIRDKAFQLTLEGCSVTNQEVDNKVDAFRHCIWNILMAREGVGLFKDKVGWAEAFCTAHEKGSKYIQYCSEMDLNNNRIGRSIYNAYAVKTYSTILGIRVETGVSHEPDDQRVKQAGLTSLKYAKYIPSSTGSLEMWKYLVGISGNLIYIIPDSRSF